MIEAGVGGLRPTDVEPFQRGDAGEEFQGRVGNLRAAEIQAFEVFPVLDDRGALVADLLGEIEVELFDGGRGSSRREGRDRRCG